MKTLALFAAAAALAAATSALADPPTTPAAPPAAATPMAMPTPEAVLARMDTDHNGSISSAEWIAAGHTAEQFAAVDTNPDGAVSTDELGAAMRAMMARRQGAVSGH